MKTKYALIKPPKTLAMALGCLCGVFLLSGCNTTTFKATRSDGTMVQISNKRFLWATESYSANLTTNGASLNASKSTVDSAAISAAAAGAAEGAARFLTK